ncbi:uncharacterized protein LOC135717095 [Ochlerotatus camptorhynchus]|uniref:uncharacterized protein LOC135717095 n=1 Tax=Ochlerotatus camptorhynchus TaxID=644619 RepID=UPI0031D02231
MSDVMFNVQNEKKCVNSSRSRYFSDQKTVCISGKLEVQDPESHHENGYTVELLKGIERREIEDLIGPPHLAERTKLMIGLNNWRQAQGLPAVSAPLSAIENSHKTESWLAKIKREDCTAKFLIQSSTKGRLIIESYQNRHVLTKIQRKAITHIVVDEFKDVFGKLTRNELNLRAAELKQLFPSESEYTWYQPSVEIKGNKKIKLGRLARGCLHDRNSNYKPENHSEKKIHQHTPEQPHEEDLLSEAALSEYEQVKTWIRHHEDEWTTVKEKWAATSAFRLLEISKHKNRSCEEILDAFPTLRRPDGYQLIQIDFKSKFPSKHNLLYER